MFSIAFNYTNIAKLIFAYLVRKSAIEYSRKCNNGIERCAKFMADIGDKFVFILLSQRLPDRRKTSRWPRG